MKSKGIAVLCALFLGSIGIHKFYLDRPTQGILYLLFCWTFIPALIALIDVLYLLALDQEIFDERYNSLFVKGKR